MPVEAEVGRVVGGRYRLVKILGSGGFGRVWQAYDEMLQLDVAVKELWLPRGVSEEEQASLLARAAREARNAARLRDHPNIAGVHDVVTEDDLPWIVMQLVNGSTLEDHIAAHGPMDSATVTRAATVLLRALDAAHRAGIVHRDVKPANVMVTVDGEFLLTDFGIAVHQSDTALTSTGIFVGSLEFLAPERARGQQSPSSDLFSLGTTLYAAVEGTSPFQRDTAAEVLTAVLHDPPPPMRRAPMSLAVLISRLMEKDPARRPRIEEALALVAAPTRRQAHPEPPGPAERTVPVSPVPKTALAGHAPPSSQPPRPPSTPPTSSKPPPLPTPPRSQSPSQSQPSRPPARRGPVLAAIVAALAVAALVVTVAMIWNDKQAPDAGSGNADSGNAGSGNQVAESPVTSAGPASPGGPGQAVPPTADPPTDEASARAELRGQAVLDHDAVMKKLGRWVPQLWSKRLGIVVEGKRYGFRDMLSEYRQLRQATDGNVLLLYSGDFSGVFSRDDFWVVIGKAAFDDPGQAKTWCDKRPGIPSDCLPKRLVPTE